MTGARVLVVSVGAVQPLPWHGRTVLSGIRKSPVAGPVELTEHGVAGDQQGDLKRHGGPDKAVLLYPSEHYPAWAGQLGDLTAPAFGENLTTAGILEGDAVLGAVYAIGAAVVQVTQPRRPCYRLAAHHGVADMAVLTQRTGRTGFYCRVLTPGHVAAGDRVDLLSRPGHGITAAEAHRVINVDRADLAAARRLLDHPEVLPDSWVGLLRQRLDGRLDDQTARLHGTTPAAGQGGSAPASPPTTTKESR
ncbi:MOSC domain-containing protein [Saccharothrix algeriensis]|uniref:MOSC domain-containing protein n=1 Tax=Saccharothrix algeriensis TaxID=173560 RepID=A0A8T8I0H0_9PSEU|nr:MOSC domain-containing protein [Saccharothrix algeriensis]MBM7809884.1 MOSC domain-containing protein YiiM [Saccharothrix algeriensis]QTR04139.1 MOSC domain-containing protein [Saccharothrix algeriensis]